MQTFAKTADPKTDFVLGIPNDGFKEIPEIVTLKTGRCLFHGECATICKCRGFARVKRHSKHRLSWGAARLPMATPAWEATWIPLRLMVVALRTIECVPDEPTINSARTAPVIRQQGSRLRGSCLVANIQLGPDRDAVEDRGNPHYS